MAYFRLRDSHQQLIVAGGRKNKDPPTKFIFSSAPSGNRSRGVYGGGTASTTTKRWLQVRLECIMQAVCARWTILLVARGGKKGCCPERLARTTYMQGTSY